MYKIIGSDGNVYGPVTAEMLRQWLAEGRVNALTLVQLEGATDWRPLSSLAQFAVPPAVSMPPAPVAAPRQTNNVAVLGLVSGLLGCICCCCGLPFALLGLVLSLIALMDAKAEDKGIAIAGLILSILGLSIHLLGAILNFGAMPWAFKYHRFGRF